MLSEAQVNGEELSHELTAILARANHRLTRAFHMFCAWIPLQMPDADARSFKARAV
jgi:hypothetical protein